jgi:hypothetical protein
MKFANVVLKLKSKKESFAALAPHLSARPGSKKGEFVAHRHVFAAYGARLRLCSTLLLLPAILSERCPEFGISLAALHRTHGVRDSSGGGRGRGGAGGVAERTGRHPRGRAAWHVWAGRCVRGARHGAGQSTRHRGGGARVLRDRRGALGHVAVTRGHGHTSHGRSGRVRRSHGCVRVPRESGLVVSRPCHRTPSRGVVADPSVPRRPSRTSEGRRAAQ